MYYTIIKVKYFSGFMRRHVANCWKAMVKGEDLPELSKEDSETIKRISFLQATTEALPQFTLSNLILRIFGVSSNLATSILQYFSLCSSILSLFLAFVLVSSP